MVVIGFREIYKMKDIDKDAVLKACNQSSCRICFNVYRDQLPKQKNPNYYGTINLPFRLCIFPWDLFPNKHPNKTGHVWRFIKTEEEFNKIKNWCSERMRYVYLRDCLSVSAALGFNKPSNDTPDYTEVGHLICQSKRVSNEDAISRLIEITLEFIDKHAIYKECAYVAAVPPNPNKSYDLPSTLVTWISEKLSLPDITSGFVFGGHKTSAKDIQNDDPDFFDKKWGIWENAELSYKGADLRGAKVLLLDDNYQSGISLQYVAMILQKYGAYQVYGLSMTKTLRDRGN